MCADYDFYTGAYHGSLVAAEEWPRLELRAEKIIDRLTYGRLKHTAVTEEARLAVCAVAEVLAKQEKEARPPGVVSESVGGQSVAYEAEEAREARQAGELGRAADWWLPRSDPLRYAGVGRC